MLSYRRKLCTSSDALLVVGSHFFLFFPGRPRYLTTARHAPLLVPGPVQARFTPFPRAVSGMQPEPFDGVLDAGGRRRLLQGRTGQRGALPGQRRRPERLQGRSWERRLPATYSALSQRPQQAAQESAQVSAEGYLLIQHLLGLHFSLNAHGGDTQHSYPVYWRLHW